MTTSIIKRSKIILGRRQTYKIWINGKIVGKIKNNETIKLMLQLAIIPCKRALIL